MSKRIGKLFVISAASGTGKTTLAQKLREEDKRLVQSVSYTTRSPRLGEVNGVDYCFVSKEEFTAVKRKRGFLEWANVFGNYYGTPKKEVEEQLKKGHDVLLLIDVAGAKKVKKVKKDAVYIFLSPPSQEELRRRLEKRGTDSKEEIEKRLSLAKAEMEELNDVFLCDYRIVNRDIDKCHEVLKAVIRAEHLNER